MTIAAELFDGTVLEFPDGTDPSVIQRVVKSKTAEIRGANPGAAAPGAPAAGAATAPAPAAAPVSGWPAGVQKPIVPTSADGAYVTNPAPPGGRLAIMRDDVDDALAFAGEAGPGLAASAADGATEGMALALGSPVDIVNNTPRILNLLPGEQGFTTFTDNPIGGSKFIESAVRLGDRIPDYVPKTAVERVVNRAGQEIGATVVPLAGAAGLATGKTLAELNRMATSPRSVAEGLTALFARPMKADPVGAIRRELGYATAAGTGAGVATESFGDGIWQDVLGSIGGVGLAALGGGTLGALWNAGAAVTGAPKFRGDVVRESIAERLMNASERLAALKSARPNAPVDTQPLVTDLRRPAAVETAVPGYRANIADRTGDAGLAATTYNADGRFPGASLTRRSANNAAVDEKMTSLAPDGSPGRFRSDLQTGVDAEIAAALDAEAAARTAADAAKYDVAPQLPTAAARGSGIRAGLADAEAAARRAVDEQYSSLREERVPVNTDGFIARAAAVDADLPPNDAKRFRPEEANTLQELPPGETVPMRDVTATRSGLTDDIRVNRKAGNRQAARVGRDYVSALDAALEEALAPYPGVKERLDAANADYYQLNERFDRPGTANAEVLRTREGGSYAMDDSAVGPRYAQPDSGRLDDLRALLREAGSDTRVRDGLADTVLADIQSRSLIDRPDLLRRYLSDRKVLLSEFPELHAKLEAAGAATERLTNASATARTTERDLTNPGRSPEASYLRYGDERVLDAVRTVANADNSRLAARQLVERAGTPSARQDLRAAFWEHVRQTGEMSAPGVTGEQRWNARAMLEKAFNDRKFGPMAEELWSDLPGELDNIKTVLTALSKAEGSARAKMPGTSGTGQVLSDSYEPALTASSLSSTARSVSRHQMSPTIAGIHVVTGWLRRRSAQIQSRAIEQLTAEIVNNPGMAADLLERYNPANGGAFTQMITQKYGVRAPTLLQMLEDTATDNEGYRPPTADDWDSLLEGN